jgi:tetratricopeptide (TPR) repeat protein
MIAPILFLSVFVFFYLVSPLIILFHELGHALAYLLLTKPNRIDVFIGSYGEYDKSFQVNVGKLQIYFRKSLLLVTGGGMCKSYKRESNYIKDIIILLAGPVFTCLIAGLLFYLVLNYNMHGCIKLYCFALIIFSFISLFQSLYPRTISTSATVRVDNDGKQILFALRNRDTFYQYQTAMSCIIDEQYLTAAENLKYFLERSKANEEQLRLYISIAVINCNYTEILKSSERLSEITTLNTTDHYYKGYACSLAEDHRGAISEYREVLALESNHKEALGLLGGELINIGEYSEAKIILKKVIELDDAFSHAYCNMGYLYILTGEFSDAKVYLDKSITLNPDLAHSYLYLGLYYQKLKDDEMSKLHFEKCAKLDNSIDVQQQIESFLAQVGRS